MNVSDVVSVEVKSNKIKTLELEELSYFDKIRKLDLEDNQIQFIKNAKRKRSYKNYADDPLENIRFILENDHFQTKILNWDSKMTNFDFNLSILDKSNPITKISLGT